MDLLNNHQPQNLSLVDRFDHQKGIFKRQLNGLVDDLFVFLLNEVNANQSIAQDNRIVPKGTLDTSLGTNGLSSQQKQDEELPSQELLPENVSVKVEIIEEDEEEVKDMIIQPDLIGTLNPAENQSFLNQFKSFPSSSSFNNNLNYHQNLDQFENPDLEEDEENDFDEVGGCSCPDCQVDADYQNIQMSAVVKSEQENQLEKEDGPPEPKKAKTPGSETPYHFESTITNTEGNRLLCPHPGCSKTSRNTTSLRIHMRIHNQLRPYLCRFPGCEVGAFTQRGSAMQHIRVVHLQLPRSLKRQRELNIQETVNPEIYLHVMEELI